MYLDALPAGGLPLEERLPAFRAEVFQAVTLQAVVVPVGDDHHVEGLLALEADAPPGFLHFAIRIPTAVEVVIVGEVVDGIVVAPRTFGRTVLCQIAADDGCFGLRHIGHMAALLPQLAYLLQGCQGIVVHEAIAVGGDVQDESAVGLAVGLDVLSHHLLGVLQLVRRERRLPEPAALQGQAGQGGQAVLLRADALAGSLLVALDVGIEEGLARILGSIQVHHQTLGLQRLDVAVDVLEGYLIVRDAAPRGIPSVDDDGADATVAREELGQLVLYHLHVLRGYHVRTQTVVHIEDGIVEVDFQPFGTESVGVFAHHVATQRTLHHVVVGGLGVPDAEAAVMLGGQTAVGHAGGLGCLGPLAAVQACGIEAFGGGIGVGPVLVVERGHVEMDEHAEPAVYELLLQLVQRLLLACRLHGGGLKLLAADIHSRQTTKRQCCQQILVSLHRG